MYEIMNQLPFTRGHLRLDAEVTTIRKIPACGCQGTTKKIINKHFTNFLIKYVNCINCIFHCTCCQRKQLRGCSDLQTTQSYFARSKYLFLCNNRLK